MGAYVPGIPTGGKTGTAENPGLPHAWFVCFAPYDDPEIVIVNFVEHGEHGDKAPAHIARTILTWYKDHRLKAKYPEEPYAGQFIMHGDQAEPYRLRIRPRRRITREVEAEEVEIGPPPEVELP